LFFNCFSLYGFTADSLWQKSPFYTHSVSAVRNITHFFSPSAPYIVSTIYNSVLCTLKGWTCWRTRFCFSQRIHDLWTSHIHKTFIDRITSTMNMSYRKLI
jgi:hypothetical protein